MSEKPTIAIVPGDPAGIGPELIAKLLREPGILDEARILLVGDGHLWRRGAAQARVPIELTEASDDNAPNPAWLPMQTIAEEDVTLGQVSRAGGETCLRCLDKALDLAVSGQVDGVLFAPFNKASLSLAGLNAEDEHRYMAKYLGFTGYHSEINVLDDIMTTRVTSHIALSEVTANITADAVEKAIGLAEQTLRRAGKTRPRIAVAALNPHAGDHGKFGREEIDILQPVIVAAQKRQKDVTGPWPSDTVFLKAQRGEVDAVVTMYHDQGQIAIKLMGFDRGVTVAGGLPVPVATPAHGTAFDIAGQNRADLGATLQAYKLLVRMAGTHSAARDPAA